MKYKIFFVLGLLIIVIIGFKNKSANSKHNISANGLKLELESFENIKASSKNTPIDDACDWYYQTADSIIKTVSVNDTINVNKNMMKVIFSESLYIKGMFYIQAIETQKMGDLVNLKIDYDETKTYTQEDLDQAKEKIKNTLNLF